jgi:formate dehydrogenase alpha subunit
MTNSLQDLEQSGCIFLIGTNTTECHPLVARRIMRAKARGAKLLVADPRRIQLADQADVAVQLRHNSDIALLNGMMRVIVDRGWQDQAYIDARTEGFEALRQMLAGFSLDDAAAQTGVPAATIETMARLYAQGKPSALCYAMGITQFSNGVDKVKACCNLTLLTGNIGVPGGGINPLRGQNNVQGACDMGALPDVFPGYQKVADPDARAKFSSAWGKTLSDKPGLTVSEMIPAILEGRLKALYVMGENPALSDPDTTHVLQALEKLELLIVQDIFPTETAGYAHVVFPAAAAPEKNGTFTNTERRCSRIRQAVPPPGQALPDWEILVRMAKAMGQEWSYVGPEEIFQEMAKLTPSYAGMSYERLGLAGLQWPCPAPDHPGTPVLHTERFPRGKAQFFPVQPRDAAELPDKEYPFILSTGRMYAHYHTATMSGNSPHLQAEASEGYAELNPADAKALGLRHGDRARLTTRRGVVETRVRIAAGAKQGMVFMPFHFADSPANELTNTALDPICKIPELKGCAVRVERIQE